MDMKKDIISHPKFSFLFENHPNIIQLIMRSLQKRKKPPAAPNNSGKSQKMDQNSTQLFEMSESTNVGFVL